MFELVEIGVIAGFAFATALLAFAFVTRQTAVRTAHDAMADEPLALLFEDGVLYHANTTAISRLGLIPGNNIWDDLRNVLIGRFPDFPTLPGTGEKGAVQMRARDGSVPQEIEMRWQGPLCWVTLADPAAAPTDRMSGRDIVEFAALRRSSDTSPHPVWHQNGEGAIIWQNPAYEVLMEAVRGKDGDTDTPLFAATEKTAGDRFGLQSSEESKPIWFEVTSLKIDDVVVCHATCIDALVAAEETQRTFVQTLAKTFAHLSIGLAIFDRNGQLALFNPALLDLSGLPATFLSTRPSMHSFFDQLRENRRMPEPKNYRSWRQDICDVITAAADGRYRETWSLEDGRTYSVQGRPHPDGATAFLIEDISAEITLTRNFRADLEQSQALLDRVDDGMAVFSATGVLTFCNAAYKDRWQQNPDVAFADVTIADCIEIWRRKAGRDVPWDRLMSCFGDAGESPEFQVDLGSDPSKALSCTAERIASGAVLVRFHQIQKARQAVS